MPGVAAAAAEHARSVHTLHDGVEIFVQCVDGGKVQDFLGTPALSDHRILAVKLNPVGTPERSLGDIAAACKEVPVKWSLPGPRTSKWCVTYLSVEALGFEAHHERMRTLCRLEPNSWGVPGTLSAVDDTPTCSPDRPAGRFQPGLCRGDVQKVAND